MRNAVTMVRIRTRLSKIDALKDAIRSEEIAYKNCLHRRKSAVKCRVHRENMKWAKNEIEELKDQVKVLYSKVGD